MVSNTLMHEFSSQKFKLCLKQGFLDSLKPYRRMLSGNVMRVAFIHLAKLKVIGLDMCSKRL